MGETFVFKFLARTDELRSQLEAAKVAYQNFEKGVGASLEAVKARSKSLANAQNIISEANRNVKAETNERITLINNRLIPAIRSQIRVESDAARASGARVASLRSGTQAQAQVVTQLQAQYNAMRQAGVGSASLSSQLAKAVQDYQRLRSELRQATQDHNSNTRALSASNKTYGELVEEVRNLKIEQSKLDTQTRKAVSANKQHRKDMLQAQQTLVALRRETRSYENSIRALAQTHLQTAANSINAFRTGLGSLARAFTVTTVAAVAFIAAFIPITRTGIEFEQSLARIVSVSDEFRSGTVEATKVVSQLRDTIEYLGATTNFTVSEVATAARVLAQAGLRGKEIIGALPAVLDLANAGFIELADAASVAADFMNAFGLAGWEIQRVSDAMAKAQAVSNTNIEQLTHAFSFAAATAASFGQRIEDVATGLALLANAGIKASRAGTGLDQIMSFLAQDAAKTDEFMRRLGSSFEAVNPEAVSLVDIITEFQRVGLTAGEAFEFFKKRAGRAMVALQNTSADVLNDIQDKIDNAFGDAIDQALNNWDNLAGSVKQLQSILEKLRITLFETFKDDLRFVIDGITGALRNLNDFLETSPFAPFVRGVLLAGTALSALIVLIGTVSTPLLLLGASVAGVATNLIGLQMSQLAANSAMSASLSNLETAIIKTKADAAALRESIAARRLELSQTKAVMAAKIQGSLEYKALSERQLFLEQQINRELAARRDLIRVRRGARTTLAGINAPQTPSALGGALDQIKAGGPFALFTVGIKSLIGWVGKAYTAIQPFLTAIVTATGVVAALGVALLAMFSSLKSGDEIKDTTKRVETLSGILQVMGGIWTRVVNAFKVGFNEIVGYFTNTRTASSEFMETFKSLGQGLIKLVLNLVDLLGSGSTVVSFLSGLVGGVLTAAFYGLIWVLDQVLIFVNYLIDGFKWLVSFVAETEDSFTDLTKTVKNSKEAMEAYKNEVVAIRDASDRTMSGLFEFAGLISRIGDLSLLEKQRLMELVERFGDIPKAILAVKKEIATLEADMAQVRKLGGTEQEIAAVERRLQSAREILEQLTEAKEDNNRLTRDGFKLLREDIELQEESARLRREAESRNERIVELEREINQEIHSFMDLRKKDINDELELLSQRLELLKKNKLEQDELNQASLRQMDLDIQKTGIELRNKKLALLEEETNLERKVHAIRKSMKDNEEELVWAREKMLDPTEDQEFWKQEAERLEGIVRVSKKILDDAPAEKARIKRSQESLALETEGLAKAKERRDVLAAAMNKQGALDEGINANLEHQERLRKEDADNQREYLRSQAIERAKESDDKLRVAELEREAFIENETKRIDEVFALEDDATRENKRRALQNMREIADARIKSVQDSIKEEQAKEAEKAKKELEQKQKDLTKSPIDDARKQAAEHLAKQVNSLRDLIKLNFVLDMLERRREIRAEKAAQLMVQQQRRLERLEAAKLKAMEGGASDKTVSNIETGIQKTKAKLAMAQAKTGKAAASAGLFPAAQELATGLVGGLANLSSDAATALSTALIATNGPMTALANALTNFNLAMPNLIPGAPAMPVAGVTGGSAVNKAEFVFNITNNLDEQRLVTTIKKTLNAAAFGPVG